MLPTERQSPENVKTGCANIKLWEKKDVLNLRFIKQGNGFANCDVIRFYNRELALRIVQHVDVNVFNPNSDSTYYEIDARNYQYAFWASKQLEVETNKLWTPLLHIQGLCGKLQANKHITADKATEIEKSFSKKYSVQEFEGEAREYRDVEKALKLAHFYNKPHSHTSEDNLYWLLQAFTYLDGKENLRNLIDLDEYFKNITHVGTAASFRTSVDVFKDNAVDILDAMARSKDLISLKLSPYTHYTEEIAQRIGTFLKESSSIIDVDLSTTYSARAWTGLNYDTITAILEALETNTSITSLNLSGMGLGDNVILRILDAIQKNPDSKLSHLRLENCEMTKISGQRILDMIASEYSPLKYVESKWLRERLDWRSPSYVSSFKTMPVSNQKSYWENDDSSDDDRDYRSVNQSYALRSHGRLENREFDGTDECYLM